jgi:Fe-S-cluster-containing dehydrogenase component
VRCSYGRHCTKENLLVRMQEDIRRALEKPEGERRWGMVIDTRKCVGCHACTLSCVAENKLPPGVVYRPVLDQEIGDLSQRDAALHAAPLHAVRRATVRAGLPGQRHLHPPRRHRGHRLRAVHRLPLLHHRLPLLGAHLRCGLHLHPEHAGAGIYELLPNYEYGVEHARVPGSDESPIGNARKCHFCLHRLEQGALPMCVTTCIGVANFFGDLNDGDSMVAQMAAQPNAVVLKEELGTKPKVFYLV